MQEEKLVDFDATFAGGAASAAADEFAAKVPTAREAQPAAPRREAAAEGGRTFDLSKFSLEPISDEDAAPAAEETAGVESADAGGGAEDEGQQEAALISLEGLNFDVLPEIDADIGFQGQFVAYQDFRFDQLRFDLQLRDAIVVLDASGEGQYRDSPLTFEAHLGNAQTLDDPDARGKVLLKLNVSDERYEDVLAVLPSAKSPTVSQLAGGGYAIESVVDKRTINLIIPALTDAGATDLLELPISKIVP